MNAWKQILGAARVSRAVCPAVGVTSGSSLVRPGHVNHARLASLPVGPWDVGLARALLSGCRIARLWLVLLVWGLHANAAESPTGTEETTTGATNTVANDRTLSSMDRLDDIHRLVTGDRISLRILEDQDEARVLLVKDSGQVDVPYIGLWPAVNKTCRQLAGDLKSELEREFYYQATVIIAVDQFSRSRGKIYMIGAIAAPGPKDIPSDEKFTISRAVMSSGGFAEFADKKRVKITRRPANGGDKAETIIVDVGAILEKGMTDNDIELKPGDVVFIRERSFNL